MPVGAWPSWEGVVGVRGFFKDRGGPGWPIQSVLVDASDDRDLLEGRRSPDLEIGGKRGRDVSALTGCSCPESTIRWMWAL